MKVVTSSLYVGTPDESSYMLNLTPVSDANEAISVIVGGGAALLPPDNWVAEAHEVLTAFGADEEHISSQLSLAETGTLNWVPDGR